MKRSTVVITLAVLGFSLLIGLHGVAAWGGRDICFAGRPDGSRIEDMVEQLTIELSLSGEQVAEIENLYREHFENLASLRDSRGGDREEMREAHRALRLQLDEQIKALLTDEQAEAYDAFIRDLHERHGMHGHGRGPR